MDDDAGRKALERLTSLEELDHSLVVVRIRSWVLFVFFFALIAMIGCWSFFGTLPITVSGKCLVFDFNNTYQIKGPSDGIIREIKFRGGQKIKKGEVIVTFDNPPSEIVAPADGEVLWIDGKEGSKVNPDLELVGYQGDGAVEDLTIIGFLPMNAGYEVKVGMQAFASIEKATPEKYGMIVAEVVRIYPFPVGKSQSTIQKIPSKELVDYLLDGGKIPKIMVICKPILNPNNPSRLEWTSKAGPPDMIFPGAIGDVEITLENVKPIVYVFPKK